MHQLYHITCMVGTHSADRSETGGAAAVRSDARPKKQCRVALYHFEVSVCSQELGERIFFLMHGAKFLEDQGYADRAFPTER